MISPKTIELMIMLSETVKLGSSSAYDTMSA